MTGKDGARILAYHRPDPVRSRTDPEPHRTPRAAAPRERVPVGSHADGTRGLSAMGPMPHPALDRPSPIGEFEDAPDAVRSVDRGRASDAASPVSEASARPQMAFVLTSGTADKLLAVATMASGAAALGWRVDIFASYWGLDALRKDRVGTPPPMSPGYGADGERFQRILAERKAPPWTEMIRTARDIGDVHVHACAQTLDLLGLQREDLDDAVEDVVGVAAFVDLVRNARISYFV